jgi:hypothetical protein
MEATRASALAENESFQYYKTTLERGYKSGNQALEVTRLNYLAAAAIIGLGASNGLIKTITPEITLYFMLATVSAISIGCSILAHNYNKDALYNYGKAQEIEKAWLKLVNRLDLVNEIKNHRNAFGLNSEYNPPVYRSYYFLVNMLPILLSVALMLLIGSKAIVMSPSS